MTAPREVAEQVCPEVTLVSVGRMSGCLQEGPHGPGRAPAQQVCDSAEGHVLMEPSGLGAP